MTATREDAVVLQGTGGVWRVRTAQGETRDVSLRGRLKKDDSGRRADGSLRRDTLRSKLTRLKLAVGDHVVIEREERGDEWAIVEILPRRSRLARRSPGGALGERVVVANLDQVVVVFAAANPEPHVGMIDRFLVIAEGNGLQARLVVNKAELVGEHEVRRRFGLYERVGYPLHVTSTKQPLGLDELRVALAGQTSALSGPSGVGKSSLVNALYPGLNLRVGAISESVNKGRHTTVGALLTPLPDGGFVADTPGLREVGLWNLPPGELPDCFPEFRPFLDECRFADCSHRTEPGCAVRAAVGSTPDAAISVERFESYCKLREELERLAVQARAW